VLADVYEFEVDRVDRASRATVSIQGVPGTRSAAIDHIYPTLNETTRTVKVRLTLDNRDGTLRPGSFATAELPTQVAMALTIPREAVIDTGTRRVVFVADEGGRFHATEVQTGRAVGELVEVRGGLAEGTKVVVSGQFLVDSESRLSSGAPHSHGGH
jgi:Cu(I)/Ag(I) efflux system membrane fusion protein